MQVSFCNQRCIYSNRYRKGYGRERGAATGRGLHRKLLLMEQLCLRLVPRGVRIGVWARTLGVWLVWGAGEGAGGEGLGVVQIARLVGKEKTQVSRTLKALAEAGLVIRDAESLRYRLGWRLFTLAATAADQQLLALTPHVLRGLVARVQECAHLSVLDGCGLLTLLSESPPWAIQAVPWVGRIAPLHCTSAGRALLFDHTDAEVRALLAGADLAGGGPNAPHAVEEVLARLHAARRRGFAVVSEEFETGHVAAAAPVRDFRGRVVAAVNVSAPKFRLGRSLAAAAGEVKAAADRLSAALAAPGPPGPAGPGPAGAGRGGRGRG